jgi:endogenous inhibitor of DNA gyrase (YacG/DUF329 family)
VYEYKCQHCGRIRAVKYRRNVAEFCSLRCADLHSNPLANDNDLVDEDYDESLEWNRESTGRWICPYAEGVGCERRTCISCGWNPEVAAYRNLMIKRKMEGK